MDFAMGAMGLGFVLTLRDEVSKNLDKIRNKLLSFKNVSKDVLDSFDSGVKKMMGGFSTAWVGKRMFGFFDTMFGDSLRMSGAVDSALASVRAVANTTEDVVDKIAQKARYLGRTTMFTTMDALQGVENLIRAGQAPMSAYESIDSVLQLAAADSLTLGQASQYVSEAMNMFELQATEAAKVANLYAQASRKTALNSHTLAEAMTYAGATAKNLGMNIEETVGWLGVLANAGLKGSTGGTALRRLLPDLSADKTLKRLREIGVQVENEAGRLSKIDIFKNLGEVLKTKFTPDEAVDFLRKTFNQLGMNAASVLANAAQNGKLEEAISTMYAYGEAAADMQKVQENTYEGAIRRLTSATQGLQEAIGNHLRPAATWLIDTIANIKNAITDFIEAHPVVTKTILGTISLLLTLGGTLLTLWGTWKMFKGAKDMWAGIKLAISSAMSGIRSGILSTSGLMLGLIALAGVLYSAYQKNFLGFRDLVSSFATGFDFLSRTDEQGNLTLSKEEGDKLRAEGMLEPALKVWRTLWRVQKFFEGFVKGFGEGFTAVTNILKGVWDWFFKFEEGAKKVLIQLGFLDEAAASASKSWEEWGEVIGQIAGFLAAIWAISKLLTIGGAIAGIFTAIGGGAAAVAGGGGLVATVFNPITGAILAMAGAVALVYTNWDSLVSLWKTSSNWFADNFIEPFHEFWQLFGLVSPKQYTPEEKKYKYFKGLAPSETQGITPAEFDKRLTDYNIYKKADGSGLEHRKHFWQSAYSQEFLDELWQRLQAMTANALSTVPSAISQPNPPQIEEVKSRIATSILSGKKPSEDLAAQEMLRQAENSSRGMDLETLKILMTKTPEIKNEVKINATTTPVYVDGQLFFNLYTQYQEKDIAKSGGGN